MNLNYLIDMRIADPKYNFGSKGLKDVMLIEGLDYNMMTVTGYYYCCCCGSYRSLPFVGGRLAR